MPNEKLTATWLYTLIALCAFAANSLICRIALAVEQNLIDPASFSTIRLLGGAVTLSCILLARKKKTVLVTSGCWVSAIMLFLYAFAFSFAYVNLNIATGALILIAATQATNVIGAVFVGQIPRRVEWAGLIVSMAGLVYMVFPLLRTPSMTGLIFMVAAGIAWGIYSLRIGGAKCSDGPPLVMTAGNFIRSLPFTIAVSLAMGPELHLTTTGVVWALLSGTLASGLGYVVWYLALERLTITQAASAQLSVPVLAAIGGIVFLGEVVSIRMLQSMVVILGGIALSNLSRKKLPSQVPIHK